MLVLVYVIICLFTNSIVSATHSANISRILRNWDNNRTDDETLKELPQWKQGKPVDVQVGNPMILIADHEDIIRFWRPDLFFLNTHHVTFNNMLKPNHGIRLYVTGEVQYSIRVVTTMACPMDFRNFPFDKQICQLQLLTYTSLVDTVHASWYPMNAIDTNKLLLPEMVVVGTSTNTCNGSYTYRFFEGKHLHRADMSCLVAEIHLDRSIGHYLMEIFFPTGLCVVTSWLTFWISPTAVAARVGLSFTTLLTLYTAANKVKAEMPYVWYPKAVDYWIGMCIVFVFGSLVEFAAINHLMGDVLSPALKSSAKDEIKYAKRVDKICSVLFPFAFLCFNLIYWTYYMLCQ